MPSLSRLLVPSNVLSRPRRVVLMPFSPCRLPTGTTRLEFVTSGRSVAISDAEVGHSPACASAGAPTKTSASTANLAGGHVVPRQILRQASAKISRHGTRIILCLLWISEDLYPRLPGF